MFSSELPIPSVSQPQTSAIQPSREAIGYPPINIGADAWQPNRIRSWHPKITPYRLIVTSLTIGLGTAKAMTSTSDGGSSTSVTIEWITGIVVLLLTFFLTRYYEPKDEAKPYWLFKYDVVDRIRTLGIPIPLYDTEELPAERLIKSGTLPVSGYRILVSLCVISFGTTKALLAYRGLSSHGAPTAVEWVYGILVTVSLYWLGMYEASSKEVMPWLFVTDYSNEVSGVVLAVGFVAFHLAALYAAQWWTRLWYGDVKNILNGDWPGDPNASAFEAFFIRLSMLAWLLTAIGMGVGLGVAGTCAVLASFGTALIGLARASLRVAKRIISRTRGESADGEETLVDVAEFSRANRRLQPMRQPLRRFSTVQRKYWRMVMTAS
ncbi:hypothetical protein NMY22_g17410 [Coprinellus aureogranulatus]|nr:hypothetical protein NMY22_g17410 [Coprinellus aureogranulatus]